jgi:hypothetical protein
MKPLRIHATVERCRHNRTPSQRHAIEVVKHRSATMVQRYAVENSAASRHHSAATPQWRDGETL